ncbi:MAG TPA: nucleotidyltransferase domain-containing protein [Ignavibacteria bacterium]|jgi:predicted nucleotidyltransferase|nr:nucleotidyltransferase domain-containing protein [Ignavibacteria bacterium]
MSNLNKENIISFLRENRECLSSQYGVKSIGLMGSFARDEQSNESDIDFIVEFDEISYSKLAGLVIFLESYFETKVDVIVKGKYLKKRFTELAEKETIYA